MQHSQQGGFTRVGLNGQNQVISRQSLSESPFEPITGAPVETTAGLLASQVGGSDPLLLRPEWKYGLYGSGIGLSRISVFDIDGDNTLEMIMGGSSGSGFGADDFWYIVKKTGPNSYEQVWLSDLYSTPVNRIAVADVNTNSIGEIYVGLADGRVYIYDGLSLTQIDSFTAGGPISALVIANVDADSNQEIVISDGSKIYVYSALSFALEWASPAYGGADLAVGNVDADTAPEIVTTTNGGRGYVLDGVSHVLQWDYISSFGNIVELGNIDGDSMAEIIGAASWSKITAFDADIKTPKWEIPTSQDIGALLVANTDGVGTPEILFGDGQWGAIHCYDSVTRTERWFINNPEHGVTDIAVGDVNKDSILEVLWGAGHSSTGPDYLYVADTVTHLIEWQNIDITSPLSAVDVGDVDDDGQNEIVMVSFRSNSGYDDGIIHIFDATTHALEWRSTDLPNINAWTGVASVKIGDVDNDGHTEFVIATADLYDGLIQVYDGKTHTLARQSAKYEGTSFTALAISDVDNDGKTEIVAGQNRNHTGAPGVYLVVFDGVTATEEWKSVGLDTYWGQVYDIELANVDNDSSLEIIASVAGERIYIYDGVTHQLDWLAAIPAYALDTFNLDSDSTPEILVGRDNGVVDIYDNSTYTLKNSFNLGIGAITGLLVNDVNPDGSFEWLVSESNKLSVFNGITKVLIWQNNGLGSSVANLNHLNSRNIDTDKNKEIVLGSSFALYQFDVAKASPLTPSTKTVTPSAGLPGASLTYIILLKHISPTNIANVRVTDILPISLTYINNSLTATNGSYSHTNGVITWHGSITANSTVTITFGATINQATSPGTSIVNSAVISGDGEIITRTATVNVVSQVKGVTINGPTTGTTNTAYPFTATVNPITATLPIVYIWQATGQLPVTHTGSLSDTITFTWNTPGTQTITVRAMNAGGTVTNTHAVILDALPTVFLPIIIGPCSAFFDNFSNPASGWSIEDDALVRSEYLDDEYRVLSKNVSYFFVFRAPTCKRQNYAVETDARWVGIPGESYGLLFSITDNGNQFFNRFYLFDVNTDFRQFRLLRREPSGYQTIIAPTFNAAINGGAASNHLKATRNGKQIILEVNGTVLRTVSDNNITGLTDVGIISNPYNYNPTSDARFDNFAVSNLSGGGAAIQPLSEANVQIENFGADNTSLPAEAEWGVINEEMGEE